MSKSLDAVVTECMKRAYWDLLKSDLESDPPKYDFLERVLLEIQTKLCDLTPNRTDLQQEIYDILDVSFIIQMLSNNAMDPEHMQKIIGFLMTKVECFQSPADDESMSIWKEDMLQQFQTKCIITFFPIFFHQLLDRIIKIEQDVQLFFKSLQQ